MNYVLDMYRQMVVSLRRGHIRGGYSNAKPIFLISIFDFVSLGRENKLEWGNKSLEASYYKYYEELDKSKPTPIWKPFYYLSSESFYSLVWKNTPPEYYFKAPSQKMLKDYLAYAEIDNQLWELLQREENREFLKKSIINEYFKKS